MEPFIDNTGVEQVELEGNINPSNITTTTKSKPEFCSPSDSKVDDNAETPNTKDPSTNQYNNLFGTVVNFNTVQNNGKEHSPLFKGFIYRGQTIVIKSERGSGSTWFGIEITRAISAGQSLFSYYQYLSSTNGLKDTVILLEAGLPVSIMNDRIKLMKGDVAVNDCLFFSREYEKQYLLNSGTSASLNLADQQWRDNFTKAINGLEEKNVVLIFDSLDSLIYTDSKEKNDKINYFQEWVQDLHYNPNITQIWIDKGNNNGFDIPYGCIDLILGLKSRKDRGNVAVEVEFQKANFLNRDRTRPFVIELMETGRNPQMEFHLRSAEADKEKLAVVMMIEGVSQSEIARRLKVSQPMVSTWRTEAIQQGFIIKRGHNNIATDEGNKLVKTLKVYV